MMVDVVPRRAPAMLAEQPRAEPCRPRSGGPQRQGPAGPVGLRAIQGLERGHDKAGRKSGVGQ